MAENTIPSSFKLVCKVTSVSNETDDVAQSVNNVNSKLLKAAFIDGPCDAVKSYGSISVSLKDIPVASEESENPKDDTSKQTSNNQRESFKYTMMNAHFNSRITNEDESSNVQTTFTPGTHLYVNVMLPKEGCTKWHLVLDRKAESSLSKIINALKSKNFKSAYQIASQNTKTNGLLPISAETYLNTKALCGIPFIGYCRYGFGAGSEQDKADTTVAITVAPIDYKTKSVDDENVFKVAYEVVGDISDGAVDELAQSIKAKLTNKDSSDSKTDASATVIDKLHQYLENKFKCSGDYTMYKDFVNIRNFVKSKLNAHALEISIQESDTVQEFANNEANKSGKDLIRY